MDALRGVYVTHYAPPKLLYEIIKEAGLTSNLVVCLDAADTRSYDGSAQTWTDPVGANNMFLGTTSGVDATDPTFNGTAGLWRDTTYFSHDGGDFFVQTAAHTYSDGWHKNNGAFTLLFVAYLIDGGSARELWSNAPDASLSAADGIGLSVSITEKVILQHSTDNTAFQDLTSAASVTAAQWNFVAAAFDEATTAASIVINSTTENFTPTVSTATDNKATIRISAGNAGGTPLLSGERVACFAAWSTKISDANLAILYRLLKGRRFTTMT